MYNWQIVGIDHCGGRVSKGDNRWLQLIIVFKSQIYLSAIRNGNWYYKLLFNFIKRKAINYIIKVVLIFSKWHLKFMGIPLPFEQFKTDINTTFFYVNPN